MYLERFSDGGNIEDNACSDPFLFPYMAKSAGCFWRVCNRHVQGVASAAYSRPCRCADMGGRAAAEATLIGAAEWRVCTYYSREIPLLGKAGVHP
jgi:hypothetical protein